MTAAMLCEDVVNRIVSHINSRYPLVHNSAEKKLAYGTAGFRTTGAILPPVAARVALIAVLRAWQCTAKAVERGHPFASTIGFMITASHNPFQDNGFKIIDEDGGMLSPAWEPWCFKMANAATGEEIAEIVKECMYSENISVPADIPSSAGLVQFGRDTRDSGAQILAAATDILDHVLRVPYTDHGIVTTPQLHFIVCRANQLAGQESQVNVNVNLYFEEILTAFDDLMKVVLTDSNAAGGRRRLVVDAANGVGCHGLRHLLTYAKTHVINGRLDAIADFLDILIVNSHTGSPELLNNNCGAEAAHKKQKPSDEMEQWTWSHEFPDGELVHYYCLDGDADRLIAFARTPTNAEWRMIDGDRISILFAKMLHKWLGVEAMRELDIGIVQTAYANGSSTAYAQSALQLKVYMAATGVKNLHPVAHARDIGIYFEANGHGTVLIKDRIQEKVSTVCENPGRLKQILHVLPRLLSQVCGDAISDMLMCEVALRALGLTPWQWSCLYQDRPSVQMTVTVPNPHVITNTKDETRALTPAGLQDAIDAAVEDTKVAIGGADASARSFVRPSGTEPIVRVYAEATTPEATKGLAERVKQLVLQFCS